MADRLSRFLDAQGRAVLAVAVAVAIVAGGLGFGVAKRLDPFGADDRATQSVQAPSRHQAAAHRRIEPDVIALVRIGNVASRAARARVAAVARTLDVQPGVVAVSSYYTTHNPAMVSADREETSFQRFDRLIEPPRIERHVVSVEPDPGVSGYAFTFG